MRKLGPVGEGGEEIGSIIGGWGGQLLWGPTCLGSYMERRLNTI